MMHINAQTWLDRKRLACGNAYLMDHGSLQSDYKIAWRLNEIDVSLNGRVW